MHKLHRQLAIISTYFLFFPKLLYHFWRLSTSISPCASPSLPLIGQLEAGLGKKNPKVSQLA